MGVNVTDILKEYPFLDKASAREPFIFDLLNEIRTVQKKVEKGQAKQFATRSHIYKTHSIKMPFTPTRDKNLSYLLDHLTSRYAEFVSSIITFQVSVNEKSKKLIVNEIEEYCYSLAHNEVDRLQSLRDDKSLESILALIGRFRSFNLSRMMKMVQSKKQFNRVIQKAINKDIFVYKHSEIVQNKPMPNQEICFHRKNYESIKQSFNLQEFKNIVSNYREMIIPRLSHYGMANTDIGDYKEPKVDYLLHILTSDLKSTIGPKDLIYIENFKSLRECIMKVDKALDPTKVFHNEILKTIKSKKMVTASDISVELMSVDETTVKKWATPDVLKNEHIITQKSSNNQIYFIYGQALAHEFKRRYSFIRYEQEKFRAMGTTEREIFQMQLETLLDAGSHILSKPQADKALNCSKDDATALGELIEEYLAWTKQKQMRNELSTSDIKKNQGSLFGSLLDAIKALFGLFSGHSNSDEPTTVAGSTQNSGQGRGASATSSSGSGSKPKPMMKESKNLYAKLQSRRTPLIALSEHILLTKENDDTIDQIIKDLRDNNLKIIMPVYNARKVLYPKRSSKLLIPDIEYLLIDPGVIATSDSITHYIDSLVGYKLREDILPGNTLVQIEKYLRNIHRQQRAKLRNRKAQEQSKKS